ncbi:hypothetical protein ER50_01240 [Bacillus safensis]|nr:hypothetical protein ER50_01240 [Bacillus safensis]
MSSKDEPSVTFKRKQLEKELPHPFKKYKDDTAFWQKEPGGWSCEVKKETPRCIQNVSHGEIIKQRETPLCFFDDYLVKA